jgi:uncharacterized protein (DUF1330 family)
MGKHINKRSPYTLEVRQKMREAKLRNPSSSQFKSGNKHPNWKGGIRRDANGYVLVMTPHHPHATTKGYVYEHRLVMEKMLGRFLNPEEKVHHINAIKNDNRPENLIIVYLKTHFGHVNCPKCQYEFLIK